MITQKLNFNKFSHFIFLIMVSIFLGCADTYTWIDSKLPILQINPENASATSQIDSVKIHFKNFAPNELKHKFTLPSGNSQNLKSIKIVSLPENIALYANGNLVSVGSEIAVNDASPKVDFSFTLEKDLVKDYILQFKGKSVIGFESVTSTLIVRAFYNLKPKAVLSISKLPNSIGSFQFDSSQSYDGDKKYGGTISTYTYKIAGDETKDFTTDKPVLTYGFPKKGTYNVSLIVRDNDAESSNPSEPETVVVN